MSFINNIETIERKAIGCIDISTVKLVYKDRLRDQQNTVLLHTTGCLYMQLQ